MANNLNLTVQKLAKALNTKGQNILLSKKQFIGREGSPITIYLVERGVYNDDRGKYENVTLYKSASILRVLLYLRDMWYICNRWELPKDNLEWNKIRNTLPEFSNYKPKKAVKKNNG